MENKIIRSGAQQPVDDAPRRIERRGRGRTLDQNSETEVSFGELWRVLRKRRIIILIATLAVFGPALAYTFLQTPRYRTTSIVEFNKANSDALALDDEESTLTGANAADYNVTLQTQVAALESDTLALQIVHDLKLEGRPEFTRKQSPLDYFRAAPDEANLPIEKATYRRATLLKAYHKNLKVEPISGTRMISVQFLDPDSDMSAQIVNTLVGSYMEQYFRIRYSATVQASDWLSKQLDDLKGQVQASQQKLVDYQKQAGIIGTDETHNIVMTRLEEIDRQLTDAEANRILAQTVWQLAKTGNPELLSGLANASVSRSAAITPNSLALIENLRLQQNQVKVQYADAASKYGSAYPKLIELQNELNETNANIQVELTNLAGRAQTDYVAAQQTQDALRASFEKAKAEANQQNDSTVQYTILKHEADSSRDLYDGLSKKLKEAGVLASLRSSNIVVVDPARPADRPARPILPLNLGLGLFGGLLLGVAGAFVSENIDETISSPEQAEEISLVPSLGFVPRWKSSTGSKKDVKANGLLAPGAGILVVAHPHSQAAEAYRSLRTSIMQSMRTGQCNVILVTSALPDEGKTTTSINCAAALAQQGASVLLIEADMRRPKVCSELNIASTTGLTSLIAGGSSSGVPVKLGGLPKLSVIPAGPRPAYPAELLGSQSMQALISLWRTEYDYIVLDTPPILSVTDAAVLAPYCDGAVMVLRSGVTTKKSLLRASEIFARSQTRIIGTVLNAFDVNSAEYSKYFGYKSTPQIGAGYYNADKN